MHFVNLAKELAQIPRLVWRSHVLDCFLGHLGTRLSGLGDWIPAFAGKTVVGGFGVLSSVAVRGVTV